MFRSALFLTALLAAGVTYPATAVASPFPSVPFVASSEDPAGGDDPFPGEDDPAEEVSEEDPTESDPAELAELCELLGEDDPVGEGGAEEDPGPVEELLEVGEEAGDGLEVLTLGPEDEDEGEEPSEEDDLLELEALCAELAAEEAAAAAAAAAAVPTVKSLLRTGRITTEAVTVKGPGVVRQELWLPASRSSRGIRAAGGKGRAVRKTRGAKHGGRILAGKATKVVTRKGEVKLTVQLTGAARRALRVAKRDVRFTVKTTTKARGRAVARTRTSALVVKLR